MSLATATTCIALVGNHVKCWGMGGTLGDGTQVWQSMVPDSDIDVGGEVVEMAGGGNRTCARLNDGTLRCWGTEYFGSLGYDGNEDIGDGPGEMPPDPVKLDGIPVMIATGGNHTCVLLEGSRVACWGYNQNGQLGYGHVMTLGDQMGQMPTPDVPVFE